jgi:hypothetical protein
MEGSEEGGKEGWREDRKEGRRGGRKEIKEGGNEFKEGRSLRKEVNSFLLYGYILPFLLY